MSLIQKLIKIQTELKAPKSQYNSFGKYNYRNSEDILEAAKPLLSREGLAILISDSIELVGGRFYVKSTALITDGTDSTEVSAYAREEESKKGMDGSQVTGASSSYARKYALNGLFAIDDNKDSDHSNTGKDQQEAPRQSMETKTKTEQAKSKDGRKAPEALISGTENWEKVITKLTEKGKTELDWKNEIKSFYVITEKDEKLLFERMSWLPF
ncbi:hypothetical protein DYBT9275_02733 [Dyadobacter sp. CECT 9275]|uniref:ERF superfamily protein n=1 Tax=Dyadobacter helix TaxID=2822344 RepID=A0A916N4P8_9BACT|nr:ERF family protein [Dyadobacter sp. CECT 9275]CAG5001744.1 hypothetical protein DYBT9275_02733 [Dyadobacter sp. CECT 9275]